MTIPVYHYDAFCSVAGRGNPAGVVFEAKGLSEPQMQDIARKVGFNETVFILPSVQADLQLRYFTPGHEINLCGHGTVAALYGLHSRGLLPCQKLRLETKAGLLPVEVSGQVGELPRIALTQLPPRFVPFTGECAALLSAIGLAPADLELDLPMMYGHTGVWTLLIPVKGLDAMRRMQPHNERFPDILTQMPRASLHPFCLETYDTAAQMHGRHFSSPYSGTIEDPVTGTASGVMGAYYAQYIAPGGGPEWPLLIEQGQEIGRDGRVHVNVQQRADEYQVTVAGTAVYVREFSVELD